MTVQDVSPLANFLKACSDPLRLQILQVLGQSSYGVLELSQIFEVRQSGMSHHLKTLAVNGLVTAQREGNSIFYRRALGNAFLLQQELFAQVDASELPVEVKDRLHHVETERSKLTSQFFTKNAQQFKKQQDLIAPFTSYQAMCAAMFEQAQQINPSGNILEVGPGAGEFLPVLAKVSSKVTALDISESLLTLAKKNNTNLQNVTYQHGDLTSFNELVGGVVINMVLHHVPAPKELLKQATEKLTANGWLMVTDLCRHDQDWAKTSCGDLWLGFDKEELQGWAQALGLDLVNSSYMGMRNGFQVQTHLYSLKKITKFAKPLEKIN